MKKKRPKFHVFNGKRYKIIWRNASDRKSERGRCADPKNPARKRNIFISPSQSDKDICETLIHEALHAELWCLEEDTVQRVAEEINDFLWKCGFELKKSRPSQTSQ